MSNDNSLVGKLEDVLVSGGRDFDYVCFDEAFLVLQYMRTCYEDAQKTNTRDSLSLPDEFAPLGQLKDLFRQSFPLREKYPWSKEKEFTKYENMRKVYSAVMTIMNRDDSSINDKLLTIGSIDSILRTSCGKKRGDIDRVIDHDDAFLSQY